MNGLGPILNNATEDELRTIAAIAARANAKPSIVVTMVDNRRYVVTQEDEPLFDDVPSGKVPEAQGSPGVDGIRPPSPYEIHQVREAYLGRFYFGGRWLRGYGRVDEMHRSLSTHEVTKVERIDRKKVWG